MKVVNVKGTPAGAANYELEDGRIFRIILKLKTPEEKISTADHLDLETVGYEITKEGAFVVDDVYGEPVILRPQQTKLPLAHIREGVETAKAGWVRQVLPDDEEVRDEILKGQRTLKKLPSEGEEGASVVVGGELYAWSEGSYEGIRRARLQELAQTTRAAPVLDSDQLASLRP